MFPVPPHIISRRPPCNPVFRVAVQVCPAEHDMTPIGCDPAGFWGRGWASDRLTCGGHVSLIDASADASLATALHACCLCARAARSGSRRDREQL